MDEIDRLLIEEDEDEQDINSIAENLKESDTLLESIMDSYVSGEDRTDKSNHIQRKENNSQTIINPFKSLVSQVEQARIWVQKCNEVDDGKGQNVSKDTSVTLGEEKKYPCTYPSCKKRYKARNSLINHQRIHRQNEKRQGEKVDEQATTTEKIESFFSLNVVMLSNSITCKTCGYTLVPEKMNRMKEHIEIHIDGLEFNCGLCDQAFQTRRNLRRHIMSLHKNKS